MKIIFHFIKFSLRLPPGGRLDHKHIATVSILYFPTGFLSLPGFVQVSLGLVEFFCYHLIGSERLDCQLKGPPPPLAHLPHHRN